MSYAVVEQHVFWEETRIYTRTSGNGLPVVLLHSLGGRADHWLYTQPFLSAAGLRVTSLDLPGHGASGVPTGELSPRWMGRCLAASLDRPTLLVGNSLGGWVALRAYLERPEHILGICLIASAGLTGMPTQPEKLPFGSGARGLVDTLLEAVFFDPGRVAPEARQALIGGLFAPALLRLSSEGALSEADLRRIRCPVLILWGREDRILPLRWADHFAAGLPMHKLLTLPRCGHLPQLEFPVEINRELLAFAKVFICF